MPLEITVYGIPAAQGSKRFVGVKGGKGIMIENSKRVKPWREAVKFAFIQSFNGALMTIPPGGVIKGPVSVSMVFTVSKPKSAPKRIRTWPDRKPDIDKLCRSTLDALSDVGAFEDDARIVHLRATKVFPGEGSDAMNVLGCVIRISEVKE